MASSFFLDSGKKDRICTRLLSGINKNRIGTNNAVYEPQLVQYTEMQVRN